MLSNESAATQSTRACQCGNRDLVLLSSLLCKQCPDCRRVTSWPLDPGQLALNGSHRTGRIRAGTT